MPRTGEEAAVNDFDDNSDQLPVEPTAEELRVAEQRARDQALMKRVRGYVPEQLALDTLERLGRTREEMAAKNPPTPAVEIGKTLINGVYPDLKIVH